MFDLIRKYERLKKEYKIAQENLQEIRVQYFNAKRSLNDIRDQLIQENKNK